MERIQTLAVPIAIIIAGAMIAGAVFMMNKNRPLAPEATGTEVAEDVPGIQSDDHILGNPQAKIVIVEYSDFECPFCKHFHDTLNRIMREYGASGDVAWIYRQFPLDSLHTKARTEAEASECVAALGGNDAFWKFSNGIFATTPSNDGLDIGDYNTNPSNPSGIDAGELSRLAVEAGVDKTKFEACLAAGTYAEKVQEHEAEVLAAGGRGTPHSIIIFKGDQVSLEGAQPYDVVKSLIDAMLEG